MTCDLLRTSSQDHPQKEAVPLQCEHIQWPRIAGQLLG